MRGKIVATIWQDEFWGLLIAGLMIMGIFIFLDKQLLAGFGLALFMLPIILAYVEVLRSRPDADKFKAMTYVNKLRGK